MKTKRIHAFAARLAAGLLAVSTGWAQVEFESPEIQQLLGTIQRTIRWLPGSVAEPNQPPKLFLTPEGYLRHLAAPAESYFPPKSIVLGQPQETARNFIMENAGLFGIHSAEVDFNALRTSTEPNRDIVRLQQIYRGIPVFGAEAIIQLNPGGGVEYVLSDIAYNTGRFDDGSLPTIPTLSATAAGVNVRKTVDAEHPGLVLETTEPVLKIFDPAVVGSAGETRLVWDLQIFNGQRTRVNERILLDAHTGEFVRRYPLNKYDEPRRIYDVDNSRIWDLFESLPPAARVEGDAPTGEADVDDAYDFLGDVRDFYMTHHHRDGIDGTFLTLRAEAVARFCLSDSDHACPWRNAMWSGGAYRMYFGDGYAVDDVVGHEYTHGVTEYSSDLIYENQSGAINESFSDMWGEFTDLTNGAGTDTDAVRWQHGEDLPGGANRNMQNPLVASMDDSDFVPAPVWPRTPNENNDWGGVHTNCGVGNKLCYLITDGDTFNGFAVDGMRGDIGRVADLFYEVNTRLLDSSADYYDLGHALERAATNLGWSAAERNDLHRACLAVQIATSRDIYVNKATPIPWLENGTSVFPFNTVKEGLNAAFAGDRLYIKGGTYKESLVFDKTMQVRSWGGVVTIGQ